MDTDEIREPSEASSGKNCGQYFSPLNTRNEGEAGSPPEISQLERVATAPVQGILDKMNWASAQLNECEQQIHSLELKRTAVAVEWRSRKAELLNSIGYTTLQRAKPVFEAYQEQLQLQFDLNEAAELYHGAVTELRKIKQVLQLAHDNGSSQENLALLLEKSIIAQTQRETFENLSLNRTAEYKTAQDKCGELRRAVGLRTVERAWPWFECFTQSTARSKECSDHIRRLKIEAARLREEYRECMLQLEAISAKVHSIRQDQSPHPD